MYVPSTLQTGEFDERVFCGLDFVLAEAARRGLKVMLVLINYWKVRGVTSASSGGRRSRHSRSCKTIVMLSELMAVGSEQEDTAVS